ncbi:ABC transporter ATP-binding protein [Helcococcus sueciensis]|uniref:ABC transporter ATP-binding protein n=1 Tax=Helcococcus sueciensis TaxID=241555 RepID=UPI0004171466|nr:ABC transporter ATP-binding protein [Helcococcus sueciensis]
MCILKIKDLTKKYGDFEVLKGINLEINSPGIYALVGPNGAGKTTLFNIISNLLNKSSGEIEVVGKKNTDESIFYETSFLKDNNVLYDYLTGYDHLNFIKLTQKLSKDRVEEVVKKLQIESYMNKKVGEYSLGMKQHLLIALAMLNRPKLMILDEPLNGLDPTAIIKVRHLFKELVNSGTAILISSHTLSEIDKLTNHIMFLKDGKIVSESLDYSNDNMYYLELEDIPNLGLEKIIFEDIEWTIDENRIKVNLKSKSINDLLKLLIDNDIRIVDIEKVKKGSEEKYIEMFPDEMDKIKGYV